MVFAKKNINSYACMAQSINTHWPSLHCFLYSVPCSFLSGSLDKNHGVASLDIGICAKWRENLEEVVKHRRTAALRRRKQSGLSPHHHPVGTAPRPHVPGTDPAADAVIAVHGIDPLIFSTPLPTESSFFPQNVY
jgi:hypothetical protein